MGGARTEKPTPRRLREARRRGQVASSRDLTAAAALGAGLGALALSGPLVASGLAAAIRSGLGAALGADPEAAAAASARALLALARAAAPFLPAALATGLLAGALQARFLFAPSLAAPRWDRLDPGAGLRRLFSASGAAAAALALARAALALGLCLLLLRAAAPSIASLARLRAPGLLAALPALLWPPALACGALLLALGLCDLGLARRRLGRQLAMTRAEVLREQRDEEGEPAIRAERRRAHQALAAGPISGAAVVVVNPTHLAVALGHRRGTDDAPRVLAKGSGRDAARLRALARRAAVPLVRDPELARSLFRLAGVGEAIPEDLYQAVAAVLVRVHGLAGAAPR